MKPALLNSIYEDQSKSLDNLNSLVTFYTKKIHLLFLDLLEKTGIKNLDEKIKVTTKFPDGYTMTDTFKAGHHFIEHLFESNETKKEIQQLDKTFLSHCQSSDKEKLLDRLKYILSEEGSETIDLKDWLKVVSEIQE